MENESLASIQEILLNKLIVIMAFICIPALAFSMYRIADTGWLDAYYIHILFVCASILSAVFRNRIPYKIKVIILTVIFSVLSLAALLTLGLSGLYMPYLMLTIFLEIIFFSKKHAFMIYAGGAAVLTIYGYLTVKGVVSPALSGDSYSKYGSSWMYTISIFLFITGLVILVVGDIGYLLADRITRLEKLNEELKTANSEIRTLQDILPICSKCKKIRDDDGYWRQLESYFAAHTELKFSHGLCGNCEEELYGDQDWFKAGEKK